MYKEKLSTSTGPTDEIAFSGTHVCLIFSNEKERVDSLLMFLLNGLTAGERVACFSDKIDEEMLRGFFLKNGISYDERKEEKAISLSGSSEVYFKDGIFDPERMLETLCFYYKESLELGFSASRLIGEMNPEVESVPGGDRLLEYESRVTLMLRDYPVTTVCQYDANVFNGATLMEVLKVHPQMIVNGVLVQNPFFIKPEEYLLKCRKHE